MLKTNLFIFTIFLSIFFISCAKTPQPQVETPPPEALDKDRVATYNNLANLKEGIWKVDEWKNAAQKICEDSKGVDCSILAEIYHDYFYGYGSRADIKKAMDMLEKGCNAQDSKSCMQLAIYHFNNKNTQESNDAFNKTYAFSSDKCEQNYALDCQVLSLMYFGGHFPLTRDIDKALEYAHKACDMNLANACIFLIINATNRDEVLKLRKKTCDLGIKEYCK
ncbi:sel1 repeat family protein [Helicobacter saguini]|uniref:Beta-lactamase n=1 Tax=Helicobacter saguini TaxID=1548018 RepID=A0A347VRP3_9HELI|nr:SEL1-like repeat protein [Helicobacter saguini]MWV62829.1 sel1 repeat family protein [Helicobacter saguini]MWV66502.1 sel1 repeat family protein [Helicobacter saguini]MWV68851.1 sel1 repeat family protein [Helicobacter saguini]MWV71594.1 sel1 repeat family protein [Helicobacter saguini]TLD94400.1 sel1 repeat family protein [Helicobacter saguini]